MPLRPSPHALRRHARPLATTLGLAGLLTAAACGQAPRAAPADDATPAASAEPTSGTQALQQMHDRYADRWYHTLRFVQKTTRHAPDGSTKVTTWYETLAHTPERGTLLRIDVGAPAEGNGMLYSVDSTVSVRGGQVAARRAPGNPFLPLIEGVYVQPVDSTVRQVGALDVDLSRVYTRDWNGARTWVVGAASAADSVSPQLWVETERLVVTRAIVEAGPGQPPLDIRLEGYEPVGRGWLATRVTMLADGRPLQTEEYSDWAVDVELPPGMFDPEHWSVPSHWAPPKP